MTEEAQKDDRGQVLRMMFKLDIKEALRHLRMLDRRLFCCAELNEAVSQDCTRGSDETPRSDDKRHLWLWWDIAWENEAEGFCLAT